MVGRSDKLMDGSIRLNNDRILDGVVTTWDEEVAEEDLRYVSLLDENVEYQYSIFPKIEFSLTKY